MIKELTKQLQSVENTAADVSVVEEDVIVRAIAHPTLSLPSVSTAITNAAWVRLCSQILHRSSFPPSATQLPTLPDSPVQIRPRGSRDQTTPVAVHTPQAVDPSMPACEPNQVHSWRKSGSNGSSSRYTCTRCGFFTSEKKDTQGQWYTWKTGQSEK